MDITSPPVEPDESAGEDEATEPLTTEQKIEAETERLNRLAEEQKEARANLDKLSKELESEPGLSHIDHQKRSREITEGLRNGFPDNPADPMANASLEAPGEVPLDDNPEDTPPTDSYDTTSFKDLKALCKKRELSAKGKAIELVERLREDDKAQAAE